MFNSLIKAPQPPSDHPDIPLPYSQQLSNNQLEVMRLLPIAQVELAADELEKVQIFQMASLVLGPAASAPMTCAMECPFRATCPLAQVGKEPLGEKCPFEQQYVTERFLGWLQELGRTLEDVPESERAAISTLAALDLQERRCNTILSAAENASLTAVSVRDVDFKTGKAIAWEDVIHLNAERLNQIIDKRRAILKDLELTPEMKTKRQKVLASINKGFNGHDFSTAQSEKSDKIRRAMRGDPQVIDVQGS